MASSSNTKSININSEGTTNNIKNDIKEDHVTLFLSYDGKWEYDNEEWFFENSKSSTMDVPRCITLSEIIDILNKRFKVNKELYHLKLEVHYKTTGSPWYPITEIQNDKDLSVFIAETLKTRLALCVSRSLAWDSRAEVDGERRKDYAIVFVEYNGKWENDGKEWFFKNSKSSTIIVPTHITLSEITDILYNHLDVDKKLYYFNLEVQHGTEYYPSEIEDNHGLSVFISKTSETKLPLCVTRKYNQMSSHLAGERRKDDTAEKRLLKAIQKGDWVKAREIVNNTEEVTWTSKLDEFNQTAFHFAVGEFKDNEVVRDIVNALQSNRDLLETTVSNGGWTPAHIAALVGNTEALKTMLDSNPKCLFILNNLGYLAINCALMAPEIKTFQYLFEKMQGYKQEFDTFLKGEFALKLLHQVIDTGLIDAGYKLIKDYPSMATQACDDIYPLHRIIRKPDLFYDGTHYNFYQRFVYRHIPIEINSSTDHTADVENQVTLGKDKFVTKRSCFYDVISIIWVKLWETTLLHVPHVKHLKEDKVQHNTTSKLLRLVCTEIERTYTSSSAIQRLYSSPFFLAVENNTDEAVDVLTTYFPGLLVDSRKDEHNIFQLIVLNRSEKVYNNILHRYYYAKSVFMASSDEDNSNILHLAGRLAPIHKLNASSGAALQMQRELQWFEELIRVVGITKTRELNKNNEIPMMVFRREHEKLRKDGEEWMKKTADSYTITAALIITIVFAAAITVPGGNDDKSGKPIYETKPSFIIFAVADAISLFTATTSLLLFLSILTARYADEDFLYKLPKRLIFGLVMLFVSVTAMMIAFSATLYIMFGQEKQWILIPIAALACLPVASFVTLQFPLLVELISSTYGPGIFAKEKDYWKSDANGNKKKRA